MKPLSKNIIIALIAVIAIGVVFSTYSLNTEQTEEISTSHLVEQIHNGSVAKIEVDGNDVAITLEDGSEQTMRKE